jgi:hypothetical protein
VAVGSGGNRKTFGRQILYIKEAGGEGGRHGEEAGLVGVVAAGVVAAVVVVVAVAAAVVLVGGDDGSLLTHSFLGNLWLKIEQSFGVCVFIGIPKRDK